MKKLLFAVCALAAISLLAPSAGFAQWENRIGIYTAADANDGATRAYVPMGGYTQFVAFNIYLVLTSPVLNGAPVTVMDGFECTIAVNPGTGLLNLGDTYPVNAVDIDGSSWGYATGYASPLSVANGQVLLATINVMVTGTGPFYLNLNPATVPSVPSLMAITIPDGSGGATLVGCLPSSGAFGDADPDFAVGDVTTPVETESFGAVKALFR